MDPLAQLHDIALAESTGWWPLAWGWWAMLGLVLTIVIAMTFVLVRRSRIRKPLRQAQQQLASIVAQEESAHRQIEQINQLLKSCSIHYFSADNPGQLHGNSWLEFLIAQLPETRRASFQQLSELPLTQLFKNQQFNAADAEAVATGAAIWFKHAQISGGKNV